MINKLVLANLAHRPVRTVLSVLAIAVEVSMILTLVGVSYGTLDGTARRARGVGADIMIRPPGSSIMGLSTAPMSDKLVNVIAAQPHAALVTGTAIQPLSGFDSVTGIDLDQFSKMSGGFHFLQGGPFTSDLGIADRMKHKPRALSGGQQQRVAIARAIVNGPAILLADEPTGNLDSQNSAAVLKLLGDLNDRLGQTILMITHDPEAASHAGRSIRMRDGKVV